MATTKKREQIAAFRLDAGKLIGTREVWGCAGATVPSLGSGNAISYLNIDAGVEPKFVNDDSVVGCAFDDLPNLLEKSGQIRNWDGLVKYRGMDGIWYWMFGYEDGGSSPQSLGAGYYRHVYELDKHHREVAPYNSDEDTAGDYNSTDRKVRSAVIAAKKATNDYRYQNAMCGGFTLSGDAESGQIKWQTKGQAYSEARGDYSSSTWTFPTGNADSISNAIFPHLTCSLATWSLTPSFVSLAIKNFQVSVEYPFELEQVAGSTYYLAEPVLNGPVQVTASVTLARHSVDTYMAYRDAFSQALCMKIVAASGSYKWGLHFTNCKIKNAQVTDEEVARHPLEFALGAEASGGNPFSDECGTVNLIEKQCLFLITENQNSVNEMRRE